MEPLVHTVKITHINAQGEKATVSVKGTTDLDIFTKFYKLVGYNPLQIMRPLVRTSAGFTAEINPPVEKLQEWLTDLMGSDDANLRKVVLPILKRIPSVRDEVGAELSRLMSMTPSVRTPSVSTPSSKKMVSRPPPIPKKKVSYSDSDNEDEDDIVDSMNRMTIDTQSRSPSINYSASDEENDTSIPDDFQMYGSLQSPGKSVNPPASPDLRTSSKRVRQNTPPGKSLSAKRRKPEKTAESSWVMKENTVIDISEMGEDIDPVEIILGVAADSYEGVEFWQFVLHPVIEDDGTLEIVDTFTSNEFWHWFALVRQFASNNDIDVFNFHKAKKLKGSDLTGEFLVDAVVEAGLKAKKN